MLQLKQLLCLQPEKTAWHTEVFWPRDRLPWGASKSPVLKLSSLLLPPLTDNMHAAQLNWFIMRGLSSHCCSLRIVTLSDSSFPLGILIHAWHEAKRKLAIQGVVLSKCLLRGFSLSNCSKGVSYLSTF